MAYRIARISLFLLLVSIAGCAPGDSTEPLEVSPDLVITLTVDQLTPQLLERYDGVFDGGFRRLLDGGQNFRYSVHDHAVTYTSPGHASPTTGVFPSRHGIVGNSWREWRDDRWVSVSSVDDGDTDLVGGTGSGSSPRNLLVDGLPDWLLAHNLESRVVSLSGKNTSAVLMGGRAAGGSEADAQANASERRHVYWFDSGSEAFVTSTHYRSQLPEWVAELNRTLIERYAGGCWESDLPPEVAALSRRDSVSYELDGVHTHFPHCEAGGRFRNPSHFISRTPALDEATLELARQAVQALELGQRAAPDYLSISLSSSDRVGHDFGPYSREQLDNLVRLDGELGRFLDFLDETVGQGRYVIALTSDHGVLPLPEYLQEEGSFGMRANSELSALLAAQSEEIGPSGAEFDGDGVAGLRSDLARRLESVEWIEAAMPLEMLASDAPADPFLRLYRNSFRPDRLHSRLATYGVEARLTEGALLGSSGTTHGVPYLHDRSVPMLFYGVGGERRDREPARTVDLAPTLARMLGVPVPEGLDGSVLRF